MKTLASVDNRFLSYLCSSLVADSRTENVPEIWDISGTPEHAGSNEHVRVDPRHPGTCPPRMHGNENRCSVSWKPPMLERLSTEAWAKDEAGMRQPTFRHPRVSCRPPPSVNTANTCNLATMHTEPISSRQPLPVIFWEKSHNHTVCLRSTIEFPLLAFR